MDHKERGRDPREREGKRRRDRERDTHTPIGCLLYTPQPGIEPETLVCALSKNTPKSLGVQDAAPTNRATRPEQHTGIFYQLLLKHVTYSRSRNTFQKAESHLIPF